MSLSLVTLSHDAPIFAFSQESKAPLPTILGTQKSHVAPLILIQNVSSCSAVPCCCCICVVFQKTAGLGEWGSMFVQCLVYATADEADAYMFYRCFFVCFCLFRSPQKYQTTVLGNG